MADFTADGNLHCDKLGVQAGVQDLAEEAEFPPRGHEVGEVGHFMLGRFVRHLVAVGLVGEVSQAAWDTTKKQIAGEEVAVVPIVDRAAKALASPGNRRTSRVEHPVAHF